MRRAVLMVGLAALAAVVLPLPAHAGSSGTAPKPHPQVSGPAPATGAPFTLGDVPCSLIPAANRGQSEPCNATDDSTAHGRPPEVLLDGQRHVVTYQSE
jgi:hypothetical protein